MSLPNFNFEKKLWQKGYLVVGIDEVGRGALAGPLVVGAVCFNFFKKRDRDYLKQILRFGINDSKKISAKKREYLTEVIKKHCFAWVISTVSVKFINNYGIVRAFQKGVREVINKLRNKEIKENPNYSSTPLINYFLLIDGFYVKYLRGISIRRQKAIVKGDTKSVSIASASIIAKVFRDQLMNNLAKKYPKYHWEKNKGYGTKEHIEALKKYGKTKLHRNLYLRKIIAII